LLKASLNESCQIALRDSQTSSLLGLLIRLLAHLSKLKRQDIFLGTNRR
jgi:hypothetical protein